MRPKPCTDPTWRTYDANGVTMTVYDFEFVDGSVGVLTGRCRGLGPIGADLGDHEDPVGVYTADGTYYAIHVDREGWQESPSFKIGDRVYHLPITKLMTMVDRVDPQTGRLLPHPPFCSPCMTIAEQGLPDDKGTCSVGLTGCQGHTLSRALQVCPICSARRSCCQMCGGSSA